MVEDTPVIIDEVPVVETPIESIPPQDVDEVPVVVEPVVEEPVESIKILSPIKPVRDKLLIEDIRQAAKAERKTAAGIVLRDEIGNAGKVRRCLVLAVGEGRVLAGEMVPLCAKPGDTVVIPAFAWTPFSLLEDGFQREYCFVRDEDIMGVYTA